MADEVDRANDIVAMMAEAAVADICRALPAAKPTGFCLWCGHVVTDGARWCDAECRDDWEHDQTRKGVKHGSIG